MSRTSFFIEKYGTALLVSLWLFFQFLWYLRFGTEFGFEAEKYIGEAEYLLKQGHLSQFRYLFYITTILVIAFAKAVHIGLIGALLIIMALNLFAYVFFFHSLKKYFNSTPSALATIVLLLSFWPFQSWSLFLFTECFFYSLVLMLLGHLLRFQKLNARFLAGCAGLLFALTITRPLGILFIPPVLLFVFFYLNKAQRIVFILAGAAFIILLNFVVQIVFTTTPDWNMTRALTEESLICDMPRGDASSQLDLSHNPNQFYQLFYYVTHNFGHFSALALTRLRYFFGMTRTYYSTSHNAILVIYLAVFYGSLLWGWKRLASVTSPGLRAFLFSAILCFAITIALQCDDYHNRFFLTLTPLFALITVIVWRRIINRRTSSAAQHTS